MRLLRRFASTLLWLALAALPLQGFAAVAAQLACAVQHAPAATAVVLQDEMHHAGMDHHAMDHGHPADDGPPAHQPPMVHCAACGLAAGAVLPLALAPPVPEAAAAQRPADLAISAGVIPRGLDRPPKHLLA